jgi:hypothetical protein
VANGHGGKRPGAGRKPNVIRQARRVALENASADAERALGYAIGLVDDWSASHDTRLKAAIAVMDRVWGKSTERREDKSNVVVLVKYADGIDDPDPEIPREAASLPPESCEAQGD